MHSELGNISCSSFRSRFDLRKSRASAASVLQCDAIVIFQNIFHFICKYNSFSLSPSEIAPRHLRFKKRRRIRRLSRRRVIVYSLFLSLSLFSIPCQSYEMNVENSVGSTTLRENRPSEVCLIKTVVRFETRGNRKQLNATSSMDPRYSCRIFKIQRGRGNGREGAEEEGVFLYVRGQRVGLASLGIKPGDRSHRRFPEPVGISEPPRRASAPVFRCIEKEAGVLTRGDGPERGSANEKKKKRAARRRRSGRRKRR